MAIVAILTLALGIGATTTMFSVVYAMLLRPPPFADSDRLVILFNTSVTPRDGLVRLRWSMPNIVRAAVVGDVVRDRRVVHGSVAVDERPRRSGAHRGRGGLARLFPDAARDARSPAAPSRAEEDTVAGAQPVAMISCAAVEAEVCGRSRQRRRHDRRQRRAADDRRHPARGFHGPDRQGRALDSAADGGASDLFGIPHDAAELHQRRGAAEGWRDARSRRTRSWRRSGRVSSATDRRRAPCGARRLSRFATRGSTRRCGNPPSCCSRRRHACWPSHASTWPACCSRARACGAVRSRSGWPSVRAGAVWCSSCSPRGW